MYTYRSMTRHIAGHRAATRSVLAAAAAAGAGGAGCVRSLICAGSCVGTPSLAPRHLHHLLQLLEVPLHHNNLEICRLLYGGGVGGVWDARHENVHATRDAWTLVLRVGRGGRGVCGE